MNNVKKIIIICFLSCFLFLSFACNKQDNNQKEEDDNKPKQEIILEKNQYTIMTGTTVETTVYVFKSNVAGPTVFITGGTHGDETAGWKTALKLLERDDYHGTIIIIPRLNRLACELDKRYPGTYEGVKYTDLNRAFPGKSDGTITQQLAYAIQEEILKYDPDYVIDLHESMKSYASGAGSRLGDQLIYGNGKSAFLCEEVLDIYNHTYLEEGDVVFAFEGPGIENSLNYYVGTILNKTNFTVETNRQLTLEKRISQQTNILNSFFEYIWNEN